MSSQVVPVKSRNRSAPGAVTRAAAMIIALVVLAVGCGSDGPDADGGDTGAPIEVTDAMIPVPANPDVAAVYLTITNGSSRADVLESVATSAGGDAELHRTVSKGGSKSMVPAGPVTIESHDTLRLEPGGYHIMIMDPTPPLAEGDRVTVRLTFQHTGEVRTTARVLPAAEVLTGGTGSGDDDHDEDSTAGH